MNPIKIPILTFVSIIRIEKIHQFNPYYIKNSKNRQFPILSYSKHKL